MTSVDAAIVGAGPAGSVLAARLAKAGFAVALLERDRLDDETAQRHVLRGEWIAPWGVEELQKLDLYDVVASHAPIITKHIRYDQWAPGTTPHESTLDLADLVPGVEGPLGLEYAQLRQALLDEARRSDVQVLDGAHVLDVKAGQRPSISFERNGEETTVHPRVIIGADGRTGPTRRTLGIPLHVAPLHHYICGLLVTGVRGWPEDTELNVVGANTAVMVNAVGEGRFRTYLYFDPQTFLNVGSWKLADVYLAALRMEGVPGLDLIAAGEPEGVCLGMPNSPSWTDEPYLPGAVLIGDAAGSDDPITGQGLAAAFRDVRLVLEALLNARDWSHPGLFQPYATAKAETLRRQRFTSIAFSIRDAEFTDKALARRHAIRERLAKDPACGLGLLSQYIGPDRLPASAFAPQAWKQIFEGAVPPPDFILPTASRAHAEPLCV